MSERRRIQITADDFGMCPGVSRGIALSMLEGVVGVTSAMMCRAEASEQLLDIPAALRGRLGVHLQLTDGAPCHPGSPLATGPDGGFPRHRSELLDPDPAQLLLEFRAQLERFESTGLVPHHLDSHHDVHQFPRVFAALCDLARARGLPVRALSPQMSRRLRQLGIRCLDTVVTPWPSAEHSIEGFVQSILNASRRLPPEASIEVSCHPGCADSCLEESARGSEREHELELLLSPDLQQALKDAGLVSVLDAAQ